MTGTQAKRASERESSRRLCSLSYMTIIDRSADELSAVSSSSKWPGVRAYGSQKRQGLPNHSSVQCYAEALDSASEGLRATAGSLLTFPACRAPGSDASHTCAEAGSFASAVESALDTIITELKGGVNWE